MEAYLAYADFFLYLIGSTNKLSGSNWEDFYMILILFLLINVFTEAFLCWLQVTLTILAPDPARLITGSSSQVNRKCDIKLTPSWYSNPSLVFHWGVSLTPAQLIRMSTRLSVSSIFAANCLTDVREDKSQNSTWNSPYFIFRHWFIYSIVDRYWPESHFWLHLLLHGLLQHPWIILFLFVILLIPL